MPRAWWDNSEASHQNYKLYIDGSLGKHYLEGSEEKTKEKALKKSQKKVKIQTKDNLDMPWKVYQVLQNNSFHSEMKQWKCGCLYILLQKLH